MLIDFIIYGRLLYYFKSNGLLHPNQFGFLPNRSTEMNLLEFWDSVTWAMDDKTQTDTIYMDFSKAFDSIPHNRLISKMTLYGLDEVYVNWFIDYFKDRKHRVYLD